MLLTCVILPCWVLSYFISSICGVQVKCFPVTQVLKVLHPCVVILAVESFTTLYFLFLENLYFTSGMHSIASVPLFCLVPLISLDVHSRNSSWVGLLLNKSPQGCMWRACFGFLLSCYLVSLNLLVQEVKWLRYGLFVFYLSRNYVWYGEYWGSTCELNRTYG